MLNDYRALLLSIDIVDKNKNIQIDKSFVSHLERLHINILYKIQTAFFSVFIVIIANCNLRLVYICIEYLKDAV